MYNNKKKMYNDEYTEGGPMIQGLLLGHGLSGGSRRYLAGAKGKRNNGAPRSMAAKKLEKECLNNIANLLDHYYVKVEKLKGKDPLKSLETLKKSLKRDEDRYRMLFNEAPAISKRERNMVGIKKREPNLYNKVFGVTSKAFKKYGVSTRSNFGKELRKDIYNQFKIGNVTDLDEIYEMVEDSLALKHEF